MSDAADPPVHDDAGLESGGQSTSISRPPFTSIIVQGEVLARIEAELSADPSAEFGGVLIGNAAPSTNFVLVTGSLAAAQPLANPVETAEPPGSPFVSDPADVADSAEVDDSVEPAEAAAPANFTFTAAVLEDLARQISETHPGQRIVGWYHSHPGTGIFLSAHDLYLHSGFFAKAWQVGYVFDPVQAQSGFFGWSDREVIRIPHWETTSRTFAPGADSPVHVPVHGFATDRRDVAVAPSGLTFGAPLAPPVAALAGGVVPTPRKRPIAAIVTAAAVILALIIAAFIITSGDDESPSSTTDGTTQETDTGDASATTAAVVDTTPVQTDAATTQPSTEVATNSTEDSATTEPPTITFPATPTEVQQPAARVGEAAVACEQTGPGTYAPLTDCFVALNNGNIMVFTSGSLRCTEPAGQVLANEAQEFTIGVPEDPIVLVADGVLSPTCIDVTYAKNVLAGGSATLDGLCGSSGTQINDGTRRCLAENTLSGAVAAVVRSADNQSDLVASCVSAGASSAVLPLTWSNDSVSTAWRIDSVVFDAESEMFTATASNNGPTATAAFACG